MGVGPDLVTPSVGCDQSKGDEQAFSRIQSGDLLSQAVCAQSAFQVLFRRSQDFTQPNPIEVAIRRRSHMAEVWSNLGKVDISQSCRHLGCNPSTSQVGSCNFFTSPVIIIRFFPGQVFILSGRLLRFQVIGHMFGHHLQRTLRFRISLD